MNSPDNQTVTLEGTVSAVIFQNPDNGYTVLSLRVKNKEHTVVGSCAQIGVGEHLTVTGCWTDHPAFGRQLKAVAMESTVPTEVAGILEYLASGMIKGIGRKTAQRIVDCFGADSLTVIESRPEALARLSGITLEKALAMQEDYLQKVGLRRLAEFLSGLQLPATLALALWRRYADRTIPILQADPYLLLQENFGVSFPDADRIAAAFGIEAESALRVQAGVLYTLTHNLGNGHTFLPRNQLLSASARMLKLENLGLIEDSIEALRYQGKVFFAEISGLDAVYLSRLYLDECTIARRIAQLRRNTPAPPEGLEELIDRIARSQGITYTPDQRGAMAMAANNRIMLLTGGPGTGKTTCLRGILDLFEAQGLKTLLCAPTGRAAKRLGELCGAEASTIHRLLEAGYAPESDRLVFRRDEDDPLKCNAVIVDETSMVDVSLMAALLSALPGDCRLVLVGDPDQLPSVGPGQVFDHLIRSGVVPNTRLTVVFRQAQQSSIILNAHAINHGELPVLKNQSGSDFFFLRRTDDASIAETIVELCKTRLPKSMGISPDQIQVLSPTRIGDAGTASLNRALQQALNPPSPDKIQRKHGQERVFRVGDRVMQIKNNYDVLLREEGGLRGGMGVFNGDVGIVTDITPDGECVTVSFDGHFVEYAPDMLNELEIAYAMTVHKSQGSEYRAVILAAPACSSTLRTRCVLYTAITRAKELLILVGDENVVAQMAANNSQTRRFTGVRSLLLQEIRE